MFVDGGLNVLHTGQELFLHPGERHHLDTERLAQRAAGHLGRTRTHTIPGHMMNCTGDAGVRSHWLLMSEYRLHDGVTSRNDNV